MVSIEASLQPIDPENAAVAIRLKNFSKNHLANMAVYFEHPSDLPIELIDESATIQAPGSGQEHQLRLRINTKGPLPPTLPLQLVVETENFGTIGKVACFHPNKRRVRADDGAPHHRRDTCDALLPTGQHPITIAVNDERAIDYAMVYVNGQKIAWHDAQDKRLAMQVMANIVAGQNILVVIAEDDQGIRTRYQRIIKGG